MEEIVKRDAKRMAAAAQEYRWIYSGANVAMILALDHNYDNFLGIMKLHTANI